MADRTAPAITVVLPAHNEEDYLATAVTEVFAALRGRDAPFEIIVVENGSSDRTLEIAQRLAAEHPEVIALTNPEPDYGRALRRGLLEANGDVVVNFDVDYYDVEFLEQAVSKVRSGAGIVVGSKRAAGSDDTRALPRRIVTAVFSTILRVGFGLGVSDTHGMKAIDRARLRPLAEECQLGTDLFDTELVLRAERAGIPVDEIPVRVEETRPARSPIARRIARTLVGLVRLRRALRVRDV